MRGLAVEFQDDFSAGAERDIAPHLIDPRGFLLGQNVLLDNDGLGYKRGGSELKVAAAVGSNGRLLWEGYLHPGRRALLGTAADFKALDATDTTLGTIGGGGVPEPLKPSQLHHLLFIPGGKVWGGSRKAANYSTGTISVTQGSKTIVGAGTTWNTLVDAGMLLQIGNGRLYVVESITDVTHIVLDEPIEEATAAGLAYTLYPIYTITGPDPYTASDVYAVVGQRLLSVVAPNILQFTAINKPHSQAATDYHELPEGANILGVERLGSSAAVFTSRGTWIVQGLAYDLTDAIGNPQQSLFQGSPDLILWGRAGCAGWGNSLVVPALDSIYLLDENSAPQNIGRSAQRLYRRYVELGYKPGAATVFRNHYLLPILSATNAWVDTFCFRLDRPVKTRRTTVWPWTQLAGPGAKCSAYIERVPAIGGSDIPALYGVANDAATYVVDCSGYFEPVSTNSTDHEGSDIELLLVTRDLPLGTQGSPGRPRRAGLLYDMQDDGTPNPRGYLDMGIASLDANPGPLWDEVLWDEFEWAGDDDVGGFEVLPGSFGPDPGVNKATWPLVRRAPFVRFRIRQSDPVAKLTIRGFELKFIPSESGRLARVSDASP